MTLPFISSPRRRLPVPALLVALTLAVTASVAGCGSTDVSTEASGTIAADPAVATTGEAGSASAALTLADGWVKAAPSGMTALFGTLRNTTDADITVTGGSSPVAGMVELHEVVTVDGEAKMQPKAGGFVIPAGGSHQLAPGADHVMLMNLPAPIVPGDQVEVTLTLAGAESVTVSGIAKEFAAGNESYEPSPGASMGESMSSAGASS